MSQRHPIETLAAQQLIAGRYELRSRLGAGSMAEVWLAVDLQQRIQVALKVLAELLAPSSRARQRFAREVAAIGRISHRNVVELYNHGMLGDDRPFLVMEYQPGETLAIYLERKGPLGFKAARSLGSQVLAGLEAAHKKGVIHRDLKPQNLQLISRGGTLLTVKILDFGISRIQSIPCDDGNLARLTATGTMLGSPRYAPLEVVRGSPDVDERSDIFEVGAVLYHALTGRPPFSGQAIGEIMRNVINHDIMPLVDLRPDVPGGLRVVVETALAHEPNERYRSAQAMRDALLSLTI